LGSSTQDKKSPGNDVAESIDVSPSFMFCPYSRVARPKRHPLVLLLSPLSCNYFVCNLLPTPFKFCFRSVIGENFEFQDDICGVVAQPRQNKDKVAIWLTRCDSEPRSAFQLILAFSGEELKQVLELPEASVSFEHFRTPPPGSATAMVKTL
jgi:hypothetical protein